MRKYFSIILLNLQIVFFSERKIFLRSHADLGGGGKIRPPPKPKNYCRKIMLFPKAKFIVRYFGKITIQFNFQIEFSSITFKICQQSVFPKGRKIHAWVC